jgi:hypothetical protein
MAFTMKKGDLVYAADATLGFVSEVYRPEGGDPDAGWAAVDVQGLDGPVYITAADVSTRDETVPSVLLGIAYARATDEAHRRRPEPIARGQARVQETPPLEVGRPEVPGAETRATGGDARTSPARAPEPGAARDWPAEDGGARPLGTPS